MLKASRVAKSAVVGRLVKQQEVGALPNDHAKHQSGFLATTHAAHGLFNHITAEVELA
jgi:hypothetical protein